MKEVLGLIELKKNEFSNLPFFKFLKDDSIKPEKRLSFAPCAAPFIMSFGELNREILRKEPTTSLIQALINEHTKEDEHHWVWFLGDLKKLGLDEAFSFTDSLRFFLG